MKLLQCVIAFSFLFQLTYAANVPGRSAGVCAAVQHKIFCYGGDSSSDTIMSDTWSLDTSNNFALSTPTWTNVTQYNNFVTTPTAFGIAVALSDGVSFLINGGVSTPANTSETNQTTVFNTATNTWTAINSTLSTQTREHGAIVDSTGKIWLWGGTSDYKSGDLNTSFWGGFTTLNPTNWAWVGVDSVNDSPGPRVGHSMTMTPSGIIVIIGGLHATPLPNLDAQGYLQWSLTATSCSELIHYDTNTGMFTSITATGSIPPERTLHTSTLAADGTTIIMFGGATSDLNSLYDDLYTYNTASYIWTTLTISGGPSARATHNAVQMNTTMFIMFGLDITNTALSDIHALDTVNWRWVTEYSASGYPLLSTVTNTTNTTSPNSNNNSNGSSQSSGLSTGAIAGIAVGAVVVVIGVGAFLLFYLRRKNKKSPIQMEAVAGQYGQQPPMQGKPLPPQHQYSNQPEEIIFNDGSRSDAKDSNYAQRSSQQQHNSFLGSQGYSAASEQAESIPPYSPNTHDAIFTSKPDAYDVPHFTLQPSKPNEDD